MKTFLKMLLATLVGGILLIFIGFIIIASIASMAQQEFIVENNSILVIDLNNVIHDRADNNPFAAFNPLTAEPSNPIGLDKALAALKEAAKDEKIIGVYVTGGIPITGNGTVTELRKALLRFRESGKFVYSYSQIMTQKGYLVASAADSVFMNPEGFFEWNGLSSTVAYYKEAMEKLGVEPVVLRATGNKYKSAVEPFLRQDMSEENRQQLTTLLSSVWGDYLGDIGAVRGIETGRLNLLADSLVVTNPRVAVENRLIDRVAYEDEILGIFMKKTGKEKVDKIPFVSIQKYGETSELGDGGYKDDKIAVIIAQGEIQSGEGNEYTIGDERITQAIRKAREDDKVKAVVLRVNSPGGSALASETIWREVELTKNVKPVIASMGDLAASGGYYISCLADTIVAQPTTITGSIGAFGLFFTGEELMNDKLGINLETVKTNRFGDLGTFDRDITEAERRILISQVDQIYETFLQRVAEGRDMDIEKVREIGGGHVYSGRDALELGLVDVMGGLQTAIKIAVDKAGIEGAYRVVEYPELKDPITRLLEQYGGEDYETKILREKLGPYAQYFDLIQKMDNMQGLQTRLEYDLVID